MVSEGEVINLDNAPLQFFQLSSMPIAEKMALKKKLRNDLAQVITATENIERACKRKLLPEFPAAGENRLTISGNDCSRNASANPRSCGSDRQLSLTSKSCHASFNSKITTETNKRHINTDHISDVTEIMITEKSEAASVVTGVYKCERLERLEGHQGKGQRMDVSRMKQCSGILKKLMTHPVGWVFNQPVDPVKLNIPDYFSIISRPMDLGTIKHKLEAKLYLDTHEFAADVRLTFSNAMRYNPPSNDVHIMAKDLNNIFNVRWKSLESKWRKESSYTSQQPAFREVQKQGLSSGRMVQKTPCYSISSSRKLLTSLDRQRLRKYLTRISKGDMPPQLLNFLQRLGILGRNEERVEVDIDEFDEETVLELHRLVRSSMDITSVESLDMGNGCGQGSVQDLYKGNKGFKRPRYHHVKDKPLTSPSACIHGTCGGLNSQCSHHNDFTQASSSDVDSERSSCRRSRACPAIASNSTCKTTAVGAKSSSLNPDSDGGKGTLGVVDEESAQPSSPHTPPTTSGEGEEHPLYEEQLSPNKALRAAILKSRFADTILKAQQKTLLNHGEIGDPAKMQREREKLEKKQREEKERIEAQFKAAEAAARMKAEAELKLQREKEREAARLALQKMEKTVDIDENREILKDLEILGYSKPCHHIDMPDEMVVNFMDGVELQGGLGNPLEQLGLFMKNDDLDEADDWISAVGNGDVEEGEIA